VTEAKGLPVCTYPHSLWTACTNQRELSLL
jgi:hypothetical protein